ncbi:MAG: SUF system Fe-S cluster assembly regulator [Alphaproteobacteria bacterium]|nr:SUF system Fe-S cluster assembly regulator [Alphaproteobacteria bacterium]
MIKISKMADYAVVVLGSMAQEPENLMSAASLSSLLGLPEPTVAKTLKMLSAVDLVVSVRGAGGGYKLHRAAEDISILEVITGIDGPVAVVSCVDADIDDCRLQGTCCVRGRWDGVNAVIKSALADMTLAEMLAPNKVASGYGCQ